MRPSGSHREGEVLGATNRPVTPHPNARACYCRPGESSCGTCEQCGKPGHTRHFPGPVPVTGAWCDDCYRQVALRSRLLRWGLPIVLVLGIVAVIRACSL